MLYFNNPKLAPAAPPPTSCSYVEQTNSISRKKKYIRFESNYTYLIYLNLKMLWDICK